MFYDYYLSSKQNGSCPDLLCLALCAIFITIKTLKTVSRLIRALYWPLVVATDIFPLFHFIYLCFQIIFGRWKGFFREWGGLCPGRCDSLALPNYSHLATRARTIIKLVICSPYWPLDTIFVTFFRQIVTEKYTIFSFWVLVFS